MAFKIEIPRKVTLGTSSDTKSLGPWLSDWRAASAYVLLADPGDGKTAALKAEAIAGGHCVIDAASIRLAPLAKPNGVVFIDAVDEASTTTKSIEDVIEAIAEYILRSGNPRFRIACRSADWQSDRFQKFLKQVSRNNQCHELYLEPLNDDDIRAITSSLLDASVNVDAFLGQAHKEGIYELLRNPLILELTIEAVFETKRWPTTRTGVYEAACRQMVVETNKAHQQKEPATPGAINHCLFDAGMLSAILVLSGLNTITRATAQNPSEISIDILPPELRLHHPQKALASKLFSSNHVGFYPRHRTIAEFLAAHALAQRVQDGLPLSRVLSQICGQDGRPVQSMRGLCAWLAVHLSGADRHQVLALDPLGFLVNGDTHQLTHADRLCVFKALEQCAKQDPWFRHDMWDGKLFGALATPDMTDQLQEFLSCSDRSHAYQAFVACVLDALLHADAPLPIKSDVLIAWVNDSQSFVRDTAYDAWQYHCPPELKNEQLRTWLAALASGGIDDPRDQLLGKALRDAYPNVIQEQVLNYIKPLRRHNFIGRFVDFWHHRFAELTPTALLPNLAKAWLQKFPGELPDERRGDFGPIAKNLLGALLHFHGEQATFDDLRQWLIIGMHGTGNNFAATKSQDCIVDWIKAHPGKVKAAITLQYHMLHPDRQGRKRFWEAEQLLQGTKPPLDWIRWQMGLASTSTDAQFVMYLIGQVAPTVWDRPDGLDIPTADEVYRWVLSLTTNHDQAEAWLEISWSMKVDDWRGDHYRRDIKAQTERDESLLQRKQDWTPVLDALPDTPLAPHDLYVVALAIEGHLAEIDGDTPEARVENLVGADAVPARKAVDAVRNSLARADIPSVQDVLDHYGQGQEHYIRKPVLLAAQWTCEANPEGWREWDDDQLSVLTAFWVLYELDKEPIWFKAFGEERPTVVADVLKRMANSHFQNNNYRPFPGLFQILRDEQRRELATALLPTVIDLMPHTSSESSRIELVDVLHYGLPLLPADQAAAIVSDKLLLGSVDPDQRIAWQVALLPFKPETVADLVTFVGNDPARIDTLGRTIENLHLLDRGALTLPMHCVKCLIQILIQTTREDGNWKGGVYTAEKRRMDTIKSLLHRLGSSGTPEAGSALNDLLDGGQLDTWTVSAEFERRRHIEIARNKSFVPANPHLIAQLLCGAYPANLPDFVALMGDHLRDLARQLRGNPEFQLKSFYTDYGTPRSENECRDILLGKLRPKLTRLQIDAQPESAAAGSKRVDLRTTAWIPSFLGQKMALPIEAKKDNHANVWTAWKTQLQDLYTNDPAASEHGIYLVFWFGIRSKPSPDGYRATSAEDLERKLKELLPAVTRSKLDVVVMDFSWPKQVKRPWSQKARKKTTKKT